MKRISMTCFLLFCLLATFLLPLGVFALQDMFDFQNHKIAESNHEIFKQYPIISSIYAATYEPVDQSLSETLDLANLSQYTKTKQASISEAKTAFTNEIKKLIDEKILNTAYLEHEGATKLTYGSLTHLLDDSSLTMYLHQVVSIDSNYVTSQEFTYLKQANKIIDFQIVNQHIPQLTEQEKQAIAWAMITYLGLSELDDWTYLDHGYESYKAKLQVYCHIYTRTKDYYELHVGVQPLGKSTSPATHQIEQF